MIDAAALGVPQIFNAATYFVDRLVADGRGARVAIEYGDARITYEQMLREVNRTGNLLRSRGVRPGDRVLLLLHDSPEFAYSFFGAIKIGAVPIPLNTLWKAADYAHVIRDSGARVVILHEALRAQIDAIPLADRASLDHIIVVSADWIAGEAGDLDAQPTSRDAPAFWLYSSGSTGAPKAAYTCITTW